MPGSENLTAAKSGLTHCCGLHSFKKLTFAYQQKTLLYEKSNFYYLDAKTNSHRQIN